MLPDAALQQLKAFTQLVQTNPQILNSPELSFFKNFIEFFGGKVPAAPEAGKPTTKPENVEKSAEPEETVDLVSDEESEVELDNTGVIEPDVLSSEEIQPESNVELSDEDFEKLNEIKSQAVSAFNEGSYEDAVRLYTDAIKLNPGLALLYAKRGQAYLKLNKPNACIRDCTVALSLNPDNAAAYKFRGRACRLLGQWLDAAKDLRSACKIDCDEQADEWLKEVTPNARKLEEHERKYQRKRDEKKLKQAQEKLRKRQEEHAKASASASASTGATASGGSSPFGSGFPSDNPLTSEILNDPELKELLTDSEVAEAFESIIKNPSNVLKYAGNPKIMNVMNKLASKMQKDSPGGLFSGFGGAPPGSNAPGNFSDDAGVD